ncbi:retrovirus-related pol polyprotein from transposon TNT 1-94 [Tanacetum coccineum]
MTPHHTLCPLEGGPSQFLQLYIYDMENKVANSLRHFGRSGSVSMDPKIVQFFISLLDMHNELVQLSGLLEIDVKVNKGQIPRLGCISDSGEEDDEKAKDKTCLVAQALNEICLGVDLEPDEWIKDSRCSKHMTGMIPNDSLNIDNVEHVDNLRFNLLSVGQICDNKCRVTFYEHDSEITKDGRKPTLYEPSNTSPLVDDDLDEEEAIKATEKKNLENDIEDETLEIDEIVNIKESRNHPLENVTGNLNQRSLRSQAQNQSNFFCFISTIEPKNVNEALTDESWIVAMQEELNQFIANDIWELVAQGYNQQEGIDYDETYAPVARLESIRILLAYACALDFKLFQMDVKSAFLNGFINEEKKQTALAISTTEAEYVSAEKACQQALSMKQALIDYDVIMPHKTSEDHHNTRNCIPIISHEFTSPLKEMLVNLESRCIHEGQGACVFTDKWSLDDLGYSVPRDGTYQTDPPCPDEIKNYIQEEREGLVTRIRHKTVVLVEENEILTREIVSTMKPWVEIIQENVFCLGGNRDHVPACLCYMLYYVSRSEKFNLAYFIAKRMEFVTKQARLILPYGMLLTHLFEYVMDESPDLFNESYVLYDRVMYPLTAQQERNTQKDYGTKRGRQSTSSSSAFDQPSSSHLNNDDDDDGNNKGTSRASTPSPTRFVNSLTNGVPRVFQNPPNINPDMEPFYTRQTKIINHQVSNLDNCYKTILLYYYPCWYLILVSMPRQLFVNISSDEDATTTPSHITTSSSPSPPNAPSITPSTKDTSSTFGTTSSSFESKPQSSLPTSNDTPSPQLSNPFLENLMDAPLRPSHPIPLQSHPFLDITLSLSPITPFDQILDTPSPPSPQPPAQPPLMGHPIYFNYHNYHGSTCLCCFHNRNLIFSLRDEMNLMFAHIEFLLNSAISSLSPPHP